jgi:hypothetical protein
MVMIKHQVQGCIAYGHGEVFGRDGLVYHFPEDEGAGQSEAVTAVMASRPARKEPPVGCQI